MMHETLTARQLAACADWNRDESRRAFLASKAEKNAAERAYLQRRAARLAEQADTLYRQADEYEWDAIYCHPSNFACDDQPIAAAL